MTGYDWNNGLKIEGLRLSTKKKLPNRDNKREQKDGPVSRELRFEKVGKALSNIRIRNRKIEDGGCFCPIIVEGLKAKSALIKLGFSGPIEIINRGWDRGKLVTYLFEKYGVVNPIDGGPALILLMDWDRTGGRIQNNLVMLLKSMDISIDEHTRIELIRSMKPEGKTVETLAPFSEQLCKIMDYYDPFRIEQE